MQARIKQIDRNNRGVRQVEDLFRDFATVRASSPALALAAHRLRHEVYCVENAFEAPRAAHREIEVDEFDVRARHSLLLHRPSNRFIGTVRLIWPDPERIDGCLPFQRYFNVPPAVARVSVEVSRFCLSSNACEQAGVHARVGQVSARRAAAVGMLSSVVQMALEHGAENLLAVTEPRLLRRLSDIGIEFHPLDCRPAKRGARQPCIANLDLMLRRLRSKNPCVWRLLTEPGFAA